MDSAKTIQLTVLGGGGEVGANCFQLTINGQHILLDCGTHPKKDGLSALPVFSLLRRAPEALLVTHAQHEAFAVAKDSQVSGKVVVSLWLDE